MEKFEFDIVAALRNIKGRTITSDEVDEIWKALEKISTIVENMSTVIERLNADILNLQTKEDR